MSSKVFSFSIYFIELKKKKPKSLIEEKYVFDVTNLTLSLLELWLRPIANISIVLEYIQFVKKKKSLHRRKKCKM